TDSSLRLELGDSIAATLSATDPNGDALTFSIVTPPTKGQISALEPKTGKFTFTSTVLAAGPETFTLQVKDRNSNAPGPGTVHVVIDPVLFTGYWQVPKVSDNGASCSDAAFRLGQAVPMGGAAGFVEVSQRGMSCGSTTLTFNPALFDYSRCTVTDA